MQAITLVLLLAPFLCAMAASSPVRRALPAELVAFSDEFTNPASLASWTNALPNRVSSATITNGRLVVRPAVLINNGWYNDLQGPFFYKTLSGNFVVEARISVFNGETNNPPVGDWHVGGILVNDPASVVGNQNWLVYNIGRQGQFSAEIPATMGTERKTTDNSLSILNYRAGISSGRLRICRLGTEFRLYRWLDNELGWTLDSNGAPSQPIVRADLPATLQIGPMMNQHDGVGSVRAEFEYIRAADANSLADCTADISPPTTTTTTTAATTTTTTTTTSTTSITNTTTTSTTSTTRTFPLPSNVLVWTQEDVNSWLGQYAYSQALATRIGLFQSQRLVSGIHIRELARLSASAPSEFHAQARDSLGMVLLGDRLLLAHALAIVLQASST